jgi:hypothetical protein
MEGIVKPIVDLELLRALLERWERQQPERCRVDEIGAFIEFDGWPVFIQLTHTGPARWGLSLLQGACQAAVREAGWDMGFETSGGRSLAFVAVREGERVCGGEMGEAVGLEELSVLSALVLTLERAAVAGRAA